MTAVCRVYQYVQFGEDEFMTRGFEATAEAYSSVRTRSLVAQRQFVWTTNPTGTAGPCFNSSRWRRHEPVRKPYVRSCMGCRSGRVRTYSSGKMDTNDSGVASPRRRTELRVPNCDAKPTITFLQQKELFDLGAVKGWTRVQVMSFLGKLGYEQPNEISQADFDAIRGELSEA